MAVGSTESSISPIEGEEEAMDARTRFSSRVKVLKKYRDEFPQFYNQMPHFLRKSVLFKSSVETGGSYAEVNNQFQSLMAEWNQVRNLHWPQELNLEKTLIMQAMNGWDVGLWVWVMNLSYAYPPMQSNRYYYEKATRFEEFTIRYDKNMSESLRSNFMKNERLYFQLANLYHDQSIAELKRWLQ
jgi:hypothetical protein